MKSKKTLFLLIILSFFVITRLIFVSFSPYTFYDEEAKEGSLGYDLLTGGLRIPFWGYLDSPHAGGSVFTALVAVPFYLIFGKNYLALKLTALTFSLVTLAVIYFYLFPQYKERLVLPLLLFFVISTPHYLQKSVVHIGNIVEPILIIFLTLIFIDKIFRKKQKNFVNFAILGFLCGFGLWVQYIQVGAIVTLLIIWFLKERLFFIKKSFWVFFGFFILGFSPFIAYNLEYKFASFTADFSINTSVVDISLQSFFKRLILFFTYWLPQSFRIQGVGIFSSRFLSYFFYLLVLGFIAYLMITKRKKLNFSLILLLYLSVTIFIISFGNFHIGAVPAGWGGMFVHDYYYLLFLQPFIFVLASMGLSELLLARKKERLMGWGISLLLLIIIGSSFLKAVTPIQFNGYLFKPMHGTSILVYEAGLHYSLNPEVFVYFLEKIDEDFRPSYFLGAGATWHNTIEKKKLEENLDNLKKELSLMSDEERSIFFNSALKGEPYFKGGLSYQSFLELSRVLGAEDRRLLKEAFEEK